ncbi:hypothetical protein DITRI_Ditri02bG0150400 [Diplodiscus trichospermus]
MGKPSPAEIGGILRDNRGNKRLQWSQDHVLIVESDSMNEVSWAFKLSTVPWRVRNLVYHLENLKKKGLWNGESVIFLGRSTARLTILLRKGPMACRMSG